MILVIGYGNPLRSDDAIGQRVAEAMRELFAPLGVEVLTVYQLTPELVISVSAAELVVFIDARVGGTPGEVAQVVIHPEESNSAMTHTVNPASLLEAARDLYGTTPHGMLISIAGAEFDYGCELSPPLVAMLPTIVEQVKTMIETSLKAQKHEEADYA
jgi:hydrogenase maturation protease